MRNVVLFLAISLVVCGGSFAASAGPMVIDAYFHADIAFPQFDSYWIATSDVEGANPKGPLGGFLHLYIRNNTGSTPVTIEDVLLEGVSLDKAVAFLENRKYRMYSYPANVHLSKLPKAEIDKVIRAGDPVWWRFEPAILRAGETGELVVRLRKKPSGGYVRLGLVLKDGGKVDVSVPVSPEPPRFEAICFAPGRESVYLYLNKSTIKKIEMDGVDITSGATIWKDQNSTITPALCKLKAPLEVGSRHCFQAFYQNGSKATAIVRAFDGDFAFGMWGARRIQPISIEAARQHVLDLALHNINVQMEMVADESVRQLMGSEEGRKLMQSLGIQRMIADPGKGGTTNPWGFFLTDEPDAGDSKVKEVPAEFRIGTLGRGLVQRAMELHDSHPSVPNLLNINYTLRPHNYYTYGQLPDILASDPYYQARLGQEAEYGKAPEKINAFKKATYIEGVETLCRSAHAPKPTHIILLAGGRLGEGEEARYATGTEKRIETFYAVGAGAKGISYWSFFGLVPGLKPENPDPIAMGQWKEMGLIGAELRTAGPVITTACPVSIPVNAPSKLWIRPLLQGGDTILLVCVNDDYSCDLKNININPLANVEVRVSLPKWLNAENVFEINSDGVQDLDWKKSGSKVNLHLPSVEVTKLIVITSDANLRKKLQKLYDEKFKANVAELKG